MSDRGTLIFRMRRSAEHVDAWREATGQNREWYALAFSRFLAQCSPTFVTTPEDNKTPATLIGADGKKVRS